MAAPVHAEAPAAAIDRVQRIALAVGAVGFVGLLIGGAMDASQFFRSYLFGYLCWWSVAIGCLSILMIQHLTGGFWGVSIRRVLEAGTRTVPVLALLFVPLVFGLPRVYLWAQEAARHDAIIQRKAAYLNPGFFVARSVFYFLVWIALSHFLNKWSLRQDQGYTIGDARRLRSISGGGLVLMGLTITFASVDWAMSLNPHWFSTIYGFIFMVGQVLSAMALAIMALSVLRHTEPVAAVVRPTVVHDLGKLMLAFVMIWAYVNLSQFLITWSGNLPEEIPWYITRLHGGWQFLALALVVFHFALPFLLLLSRDLKRDIGLLAPVAGAVFFMRFVDLFWFVAPDLGGHHAPGAESHLSIHVLDVAAALALGGVWLAAFARELKRRPLVPATDPELRELLEEPVHGTH